ncbi:DUF5808 domain-containing protein [Actinotalea sp. M2MS4P-6]|uniref:DUF5808 domain-containing protein n=1 Tax=Actinotalea sp. M2MS4P-6 TaxID=2983762 RepID=UPI0021E4A258|nr:DUF5808 domain-containing protein [Actinotalea sp. M2MS4P-6]MCV2396195.1 DUF5808 domain-containing protein [Actinotalea sp. M2MS4P-6]
MTDEYLRAVRAHLARLPEADRSRALSALSAQLDELAAIGADPVEALGDPATYAADLLEALAEESPTDSAQWRVLGLPVETRGPVSAEVRSRTWDPANPSLVVPRLFGIGWTLNLGAVAVRMGLIRPDDTDDEVLANVPEGHLRAAQAVPIAIAGATAAGLALVWRGLPATVASGFDVGGRSRGDAPRSTLLAALALGVGPALWAQRRDAAVEDRLVSAASATSLATISAGVVLATVAEARHPRGRWGLLVPAALPVGAAASLAVVVGPLRAGLRRAWRGAAPETSTPMPTTEPS